MRIAQGSRSLFLLAIAFASCKRKQANQEGESGSEVASLTASPKFPGTTKFTSPNKIVEKCQILPRMPNADYDEDDAEDEKEFCNINFYDETVGLCPKIKSTSPATYVFKIEKAGMKQPTFESQHCDDNDAFADKIAAFKQTMNANKTSGTFSTSSLLYYHFSRYIDSTISVPVSVYREMDRKAHLDRVAKKGQALTKSGMIDAAWNVLVAAEQNPDSYNPVFELFTSDKTKIYGVLLRAKGERYGVEVNGIRHSWGVGDNQDFQKTPGFEVLKRAEDFKEAIQNTKANYDDVIADLKRISKDKDAELDKFNARVKSMPLEQLAFWAAEISEIVLFDYIFSQQDRVGNIDYVWEWTYKVKDPNTNEVVVRHEKVDRKFKDAPSSSYATIAAAVPEKIKAYSPKLLQRTILGDNDAGGRRQFSNFAKQTKMLENIKHFNGKAFSRLLALNSDLQSSGPIHKYLVDNFPLSEADQVKQIFDNVKAAAGILKSACDAKKLKLDLSAKQFFLTGDTSEKYNCNGQKK